MPPCGMRGESHITSTTVATLLCRPLVTIINRRMRYVHPAGNTFA